MVKITVADLEVALVAVVIALAIAIAIAIAIAVVEKVIAMFAVLGVVRVAVMVVVAK